MSKLFDWMFRKKWSRILIEELNSLEAKLKYFAAIKTDERTLVYLADKLRGVVRYAEIVNRYDKCTKNVKLHNKQVAELDASFDAIVNNHPIKMIVQNISSYTYDQVIGFNAVAGRVKQYKFVNGFKKAEIYKSYIKDIDLVCSNFSVIQKNHKLLSNYWKAIRELPDKYIDSETAGIVLAPARKILSELTADGFHQLPKLDSAVIERHNEEFIEKYKLPVITLDEKTPREAVCKVFENVNTGGVALTVFELVTATFATYEFDLRKDWEESKKQIRGTDEQLKSDVLDGIDETAYLTAVTLYASYQAKLNCGKAVSCKKKDVLGLPYQSYLSCKDKVISGFKMARKFLLMQYIFRKKDVPYTTQIIPLSVICATIGQSVFDRPDTQKIIEKWFWCGILGEMYGGANETRYANDVEDVIAEVKGQPSQYRTINSSYFSATRLLSLNTRGSAAYKGIMALIYKNQCRDFCKGTTMNLVISMDERPDIHHIFPQDYCKAQGFLETKWDCIINKTPLLPQSNRSIGGDAPSIYTKNIIKKVNISETELKTRIETNLVNYDLLVSDNFDEYFIDRAKKLLVLIDNAMGKQVADRGSENVIQKYGQSLQ